MNIDIQTLLWAVSKSNLQPGAREQVHQLCLKYLEMHEDVVRASIYAGDHLGTTLAATMEAAAAREQHDAKTIAQLQQNVQDLQRSVDSLTDHLARVQTDTLGQRIRDLLTVTADNYGETVMRALSFRRSDLMSQMYTLVCDVLQEEADRLIQERNAKSTSDFNG